MKQILLISLLAAFSVMVNAQIQLVQVATGTAYTVGVPEGERFITTTLEVMSTPGNLLIAAFGSRNGDGSNFFPVGEDSGWEKLTEAVNTSGGRVIVFSKFADVSDLDQITFNVINASQYVMVVAEYSNVDSVELGEPPVSVQVGTTASLEFIEEIELGPINVAIGDVAVAAVAIRALDFSDAAAEMFWSDGFDSLAQEYIGPNSNHLTISMAAKMATVTGNQSVTASWVSAECQPSGVMFVLKPEAVNATLVNSFAEPSIFPVPARQVVNVTNLDAKAKAVRVIGPQGNVLIDRQVLGNELPINTGSLSSGMYILQVVHEGGFLLNRKLLIN